MGKYDPLRAYLSGISADEVKLDFSKIETLVGALPKAARLNGEWWVNGSAVQALAWQRAGWRVESADRVSGVVMFARGLDSNGSSATPASIPSLADFNDPQHENSPAVPEAGFSGEPTSVQLEAPSEDSIRRWPTLLAAAVTAIGVAVITIVGLTEIPRWAIFLIALDLSAFVTVITLTITNVEFRIAALWAGNALLIALVAGIAAYNLIPEGSVTINVVPNSSITLSSQAGNAPDSGDPNAMAFPADVDETATCYSIVNGKTWLYFHFSDEQTGWAPLADFHYDPGFAQGLPSRC